MLGWMTPSRMYSASSPCDSNLIHAVRNISVSPRFWVTCTSKHLADTHSVLCLSHRMFGAIVRDFTLWKTKALIFSKLVWKRNKYVPGLGAFHASDLRAFYNLTGALDWVGFDAISACLFAFHAFLNIHWPLSVNFASTLDPNTPDARHLSEAQASLPISDINWPRWTPDCPELLTFEEPDLLTLSNDTYREEAVAYLTSLSNQMGLWRTSLCIVIR